MFNGVKTQYGSKYSNWSNNPKKFDWFLENEYMDMMTKSRRTELRLLPRSEARRWDEMPSDILVQIFLRVPYFFLLNISSVSRSWRSSVLATVFPLTEVLDLTILDSLPMYLHNIYLFLLKVLLDTRPQTLWKRLIFPDKVRLKDHAICYIVNRSPSVESVWMDERQIHCISNLFPCWKNLKCFVLRYSRVAIYSIVEQLGTHCKNISRLSLTTKIGVETAYAIVECLPEIKYLNLGKSTITIKALLVLDGLKNLHTLDLEHSLCVERVHLNKIYHEVLAYVPCRKLDRAKLWDREICAMVSGDKNYCRCQQNQCPECSWAYQP
ncbi:hypothetical protein ACHQM5_028601 [Ranunculus cassubicifolius]